MNLQEIKGFPNYMFNADTGDIISKLQRKKKLKIGHSYQRETPRVMLVQDGKRRWVFYNRLLYAMQNNIGYDDIPKELFIVKDNDGNLTVTDKRGMAEVCVNRVKAARRCERIKRIDEKIHELEIIRRAYTEGSHVEVAQYIESRKELFIRHSCKKYGASRKTVEMWYNLAFEKMIERIDCDMSQVTELTVSMMGLMNKVRLKLQAERPLGLLKKEGKI